MKAISLISRRADLSREQFRQYYETTHCWLAMRHFPFSRYTRNHLLSHPQLDFDCISEFELSEDLSEYDLMASGSRRQVLADEQQFMDQKRIRVAGAEEHLLITRRDEVADDQLVSQVLLLQQDAASLLAQARQLALRLSESRPDLLGMRLDVVHSNPQAPFPCTGLLWLDWRWSQEPLPVELTELPSLVDTLQVTRQSTSPAQLQQNFIAFVP